jgi:hypothetical protein
MGGAAGVAYRAPCRSSGQDGLWDAAAFVNLLSTSDPATGSFKQVNSGAGPDLRIKLNKRSTTTITLDYAVGQEGSKGIFLGTGEAF